MVLPRRTLFGELGGSIPAPDKPELPEAVSRCVSLLHQPEAVGTRNGVPWFAALESSGAQQHMAAEKLVRALSIESAANAGLDCDEDSRSIGTPKSDEPKPEEEPMSEKPLSEEPQKLGWHNLLAFSA